jgi:hypothetical protein
MSHPSIIECNNTSYSNLNLENDIKYIKNKLKTHNFTINEKKEIINKIKTFSKIEHIEIFKIIKDNGVKYTENSNGIFINFVNIENNVIKLLDNFINFCSKNKDALVEKEIIINQNKNIIENKYVSSSSSNSEGDISSSEDEDETRDIDGSKINLKKNKPTYTGIKAQIIKNYKDCGRLNK